MPDNTPSKNANQPPQDRPMKWWEIVIGTVMVCILVYWIYWANFRDNTPKHRKAQQTEVQRQEESLSAALSNGPVVQGRYQAGDDSIVTVLSIPYVPYPRAPFVERQTCFVYHSPRTETMICSPAKELDSVDSTKD